MPLKSFLLVVVAGIFSLSLTAQAGAPGNYPPPHYIHKRHPRPAYPTYPGYPSTSGYPATPGYAPTYPGYPPQGGVWVHKHHRVHSSYDEDDETDYFRPDRNYYCPTGCVPPPAYAGMPAYPVPPPMGFAGGFCALNPVGPGIFDLLLNGRPIYRGPSYNTVAMFNYYRASHICLN